MSDVLSELTNVLEQRKQIGDPNSSYVAQLHHKGLNKILEKVGEEATEVILAAKDAGNSFSKSGSSSLQSTEKKELIGETADLWFHSLVMLSHLGCNANDVLEELSRRFDLSGLEEKASRNT